MADEIQNLLEKIQKDGVDKARTEAEKILASAREQAIALVKDAEKSAQTMVKQAREEADVFEARGKKTLEQAARDIVISVGNAIERILKAVVAEKTGEALSAEALGKILEAAVRAYVEKGMIEGRLEILVGPEDVKKLGSHFMGQLRSRFRDNVEIRAERGVRGGFMASFKDGKLHHDFTTDAIADAICEGIRPQLAEIVKTAAKEMGAGGGR